MLSSRRNLKRNLKLRCKKVCKIFDDSGKISTFKYIIWDGIKDRATFTFFFPFRMSCNIYFEKWLLKYFNVKCCLEEFFLFFLSIKFPHWSMNIFGFIFFILFMLPVNVHKFSLEFLCGGGFWNVIGTALTEIWSTVYCICISKLAIKSFYIAININNDDDNDHKIRKIS